MTTVSSQPESQSLSLAEHIRRASRTAHDRAQTAPFIKRLLKGTASLEEYTQHVAQYFFVYEALEQASERMRTSADAGVFVKDELLRLPALEADLQFLLGSDWRERIAPTPVTAAYVDRITSTSADPARFLAHHYVRYMGDLSGGQVLGRIVRHTYNFETEDGSRFFQFDAIPDPAAFKDEYRASLNDGAWSDADRQAIVDEVLLAYQMNFDLVASI